MYLSRTYCNLRTPRSTITTHKTAHWGIILHGVQVTLFQWYFNSILEYHIFEPRRIKLEKWKLLHHGKNNYASRSVCDHFRSQANVVVHYAFFFFGVQVKSATVILFMQWGLYVVYYSAYRFIWYKLHRKKSRVAEENGIMGKWVLAHTCKKLCVILPISPYWILPKFTPLG